MIVLIGFMGAGKSTVGRLVAARLGQPFFDTDGLIEAREGRSIAEIFQSGGEPEFREIEREVVIEVLSEREGVVALGGGALADPVVAANLQGKTVVHLIASWGEIQRRLRHDVSRPLLTRGDPTALFEARRSMYEMVRTMAVETDGRTPEDSALEIAIAVGGPGVAQDHMQRVVVPLGERSYEVCVGRDILREIASFVPAVESVDKAFLIGHPSTERLSKEIADSFERAGVRVHALTLAEGEGSKQLGKVEEIWLELAAHEAHRNDLIVGVGGGVVCDVAGFVAATYARGLPLVQVPTTLLAQVDAAIGGKCGVNLPAGKNLIGSIYQPRAVVCDVDVLTSLPQEELRSGMAEVVKYGFIADPEWLEGLTVKASRVYDGDVRATVEIVARAAAIKASFVATDERDQGKRAFLNYGHTFGHAIEKISGFGRVRHGEAVALGMMAAAYLSHELDRMSEFEVAVHKRVLDSVGLPTTADLDLEELKEAWRHDKKNVGGPRFVLLRGLGTPEAGVEAPEAALRAALGRMKP